MVSKTLLINKKFKFPYKINLLFDIYSLSCLLLFLKTFNFKFFWSLSLPLLLIFNLGTFFLYAINFRKLTIPPSEQLFFIGAAIILQVISNHLDGAIGQIINILCISTFLFIPDEKKIKIFKLILNIYTVIMLVSLIGWILIYIVRIPLPKHEVQFQHYEFYDYGIVNIRIDGQAFSRYLGMFIEPGYTGVMTVLMLIANGFDLHKKQNLILLICTLFTLSLAAILLLGIYIFLTIPISKKSRIVVFLGIFFMAILFTYAAANKDSILWTFVFSRVEKMLNGNITGNRFSDKFMTFYTNNITNSYRNYLFGVGSEFFNTLKLNSCGSKVYIAQFGLINTILIVLFYLSCNIRNFSKKNLVFFIVWLASFVDMAYPTWLCFLIIYNSGAINLKSLEVKNGRYTAFYI